MSVDSGESFELLKAALALAAVDGRISGHEKAVVKALAARAGVGQTSLDAMTERAKTDPLPHDEIFGRALKEPERAMRLQVAIAAIDGHIDEKERSLLVDISTVRKVPIGGLDHIFEAGLTASKRVRDGRGDGS